MSNEISQSLLEFVVDCGGVEFVRMIASGHNPCDNQKIVAVAKATICKIEQTRVKEK